MGGGGAVNVWEGGGGWYRYMYRRGMSVHVYYYIPSSINAICTCNMYNVPHCTVLCTGHSHTLYMCMYQVYYSLSRKHS